MRFEWLYISALLKTAKLLEKFLPYYKSNIDSSGQQTTLLALSGGVDSTVLCYLYKAAGFPFAIAHCNFKLRGENSDKDEQFLRKLAAQLNVNFHCTHFETAVYARQNKMSIQLAARHLRYSWLKQTREENNYDFLATAHHLNDSVETMLHNLIRSCGIRGLHGIAAKRDQLIRPLLFAEKKEIIAFAEKNQIAFREDVSNSSTKYTRNFIRRKIIPLLEEINPNFIESSGNTIERIRQTEFIYLEAIENFKKQYCEIKDGLLVIDLKKLAHHYARENILFEILSPKGFNYTQIKQILETGHNNSGRFFHTPGYELLINRDEAIVRKKTEKAAWEIDIEGKDQQVELSDGKFIIELINSPEKFDASPNVAYFDAEKIHFPLKIRHWQAGDTFQPFGMFGQAQKLKDFFINHKLSVFEKEHVKIMLSNKKICWVVGFRADHRFSLDKSSTHCYRVEWIRKGDVLLH